jgi:hypothetical protein
VNKDLSIVALATAFAFASAAIVSAQDKPGLLTPPKPYSAPIVTPLKLQVTISRYQGEKKLSSLPYALSVNSTRYSDPTREPPAGRGNLRMGTKIPISMMTPLMVDGKPATGLPTASPIQYQDVGTNIDCLVWPLDEARYRVDLTIEDSSVFPDDKDVPAASKGSPSFRSFRASDSMVLRDGGTAQFTTATDKVSGEIVKVDVTLTVVK